MSLNNIDNCPSCGKVFVKALRPVCNECHREVEKKFNTVYTFIKKRENRMASLEEVHEGTEVEKDLIVHFIREGRIHLAQFPNLGYPCEKCGSFIREGRICKECRSEIRSGLDQIDREKSFEDRKKQTERSKVTTYHSLNQRLNRK
ncbi:MULTISPECIES: TIGR03826 family flagellar region protein [Bacillaceae]|uniref:Uncharacterized protein n=1 Tax=Evansella alkalicola TaxID=745819 RepID=A0ABS6JU03_9BACI|nr:MULTISPECIES: TIGR03826 family flagellar region protein [Bacillaceae]MBU9721732.1 hypothetical protein [Bacillus alkalicola]